MKTRAILYFVCFLCFALCFEVMSQNKSQKPQELRIQKLAEIADEDLKDIALFPITSNLGLRPKILVKKQAIEFLNPEGTIVSRIDFEHEFYTSFSANEKYVTAVQTTKIPKEKSDVGSGEFKLFDETGVLLWQESFAAGWDGHTPLYLVSSQGSLCKVDQDRASICFYNSTGAKLLEHALWHSSLHSLKGEWSQDGRYFAMISPHHRERIGNELKYDDKIGLWGLTGNKLWEQILSNKSLLDVFISPNSEWILIRYKDMISRNYGVIQFSNSTALPTKTIDEISSGKVYFSPHDNFFIIVSGTFLNPSFALYESTSTIKTCDVQLPQSIIDVKFSADEELIYVMLGERRIPKRQIQSRQRNGNSKSEPSQPGSQSKADFTNIQIVLINLRCDILGMVRLPDFDSKFDRLEIYSASGSDGFFIKAGGNVSHYKLFF